jgi:hypothetical protein
MRKSEDRKSEHHKWIPALATLAAASLAYPQAATPSGAKGTPRSAPAADTAYGLPYPDSNAAGSGMGGTGLGGGAGTGRGGPPGLGGSSLDSAYGRDTVWSSPDNGPATPGTGLPNSPGAGWPATGGTGGPGTGGTGTGGSGMGDTAGTAPAAPGTGPAAPALPGAPRDSIGAPDWMERG